MLAFLNGHSWLYVYIHIRVYMYFQYLQSQSWGNLRFSWGTLKWGVAQDSERDFWSNRVHVGALTLSSSQVWSLLNYHAFLGCACEDIVSKTPQCSRGTLSVPRLHWGVLETIYTHMYTYTHIYIHTDTPRHVGRLSLWYVENPYKNHIIAQGRNIGWQQRGWYIGWQQRKSSVWTHQRKQKQERAAHTLQVTALEFSSHPRQQERAYHPNYYTRVQTQGLSQSSSALLPQRDCLIF